jgi:hypothetical protein
MKFLILDLLIAYLIQLSLQIRTTVISSYNFVRCLIKAYCSIDPALLYVHSENFNVL